MKIILRTQFNQDIQVELLKIVDEMLHYKQTLRDKKWQTISRSNISHISVQDMTNF